MISGPGLELPRNGASRLRFSLVLKKFFWHAYDHPGKLIAASLLSASLALTIMGLPLALVILARLGTELACYREIRVAQMFRMTWRRIARGAALVGIGVGGAFVILSGLVFYGSDRLHLPLLSLVLLGLTVWFGLAFAAWYSLWVPLAFRYEAPLLELGRAAGLLLLANPLASLLHLTSQLIIWLFGALTVVGLFLMSPGLSALLAAVFTRELIGVYEPGSIPEDEETRTLADFLRPWRM
jgi:hypothetical protein